MKKLTRGPAALVALALVLPAEAQHDPAMHSKTPGATAAYSGLEKRGIKALSAEEISQFLAGQGMGLALAAELNHYPGPKHVLELADKLGLSGEQTKRIEALRDAMSVEAIRLGERIVDQERDLDHMFAAGGASVSELRRLTTSIARLQGDLRATHLGAHIGVRAVLSAAQVRLYDELRGYLGESVPGSQD